MKRALLFLDKMLGNAAISACSILRNKTVRCDAPERFLFIRPGGIGDAVLLLKAIQTLKTANPIATIDVLAETRNADVFSLLSSVHTTYRYDVPREFLSCLTNRYHAVIDSEQWYKLSAVVGSIVRASVRVGFSTNERRQLLDIALPYAPDEYEERSFLRLVKPFVSPSLQHNGAPPMIRCSSNFGLPNPLSDRTIIAVAPGSTVAEKVWHQERYISVITQLSQKKLSIILLGGKADTAMAREIAAQCPDCINLCGTTSLTDAVSVLQHCQLLISPDCGIMHLAYVAGIKTLSLFGPSNPLKWAPSGPHHKQIWKNLPCSPCSQFGTIPPCPHNGACMKQIFPEEVVAAALELLE